MSVSSKGVAIACAALIVASLVGCSSVSPVDLSGARHVGALAVTPASTPSQTPTPTPTPTPAVPPQAAACATTPAGVDHIYVSISQQTLWACTGPTLFATTAVTTGASALTNVHDATPVGTWRIYSKVRNTVLVGHDANGSWRDAVAYWMPFYEGYGFHDASWQKFPFGSPLYTTQGSHGCVHVPVAVLGALYNWAPIGTLVTVQA
jgi:lipoprotein-anchoring transpeptidase ErfK/SrfK